MRHRMAHRKLGRDTPHRIALLRNLATALFEKERIRTTLAKAKELRPFAEKLITLARRDDDRLHARRLVLRDIRDANVVRKLFDSLGSRYATRPGGYTRILRLGPRRGDGAEMAIVELLGSELQAVKDQQPTKEAAKKEVAASKAKPGSASKKASAKPKAQAGEGAAKKKAAKGKTAKRAQPKKGT